MGWFILFLLTVAKAQEPRAALPPTRGEMEELLSTASIGNEREIAHAMRVTLDDGKQKHDAALWTLDRNDEGNIYSNVAAYELDKVLELNMVAPAVERTVKGQRAVMIWWVDNVAMMETDRRRKNIQPPDGENWNRQLQAVRMFDELMSNAWRSMDASASWNELLITRDWKVQLIDHRDVFRTRRQLQNPETLVQCDRMLLGKLRGLNRKVFQQRLARYLTSEQLDALEARRGLLVKHFDDLIVRKGEAAVLYDLPPRQ